MSIRKNEIRKTEENKTKLIIAGVAVVASFFILNKIFNGKISKKDKDKILNEYISNKTIYEYVPENTTITKDRALIIANSLYNYMKDSGTDETQFLNVIETLSPDDLRLVSNAFGTKLYYSVGEEKWWDFGGGTPETLYGWVVREFSGDSLDYIVSKFQAAGINA